MKNFHGLQIRAAVAKVELEELLLANFCFCFILHFLVKCHRRFSYFARNFQSKCSIHDLKIKISFPKTRSNLRSTILRVVTAA